LVAWNDDKQRKRAKKTKAQKKKRRAVKGKDNKRARIAEVKKMKNSKQLEALLRCKSTAACVVPVVPLPQADAVELRHSALDTTTRT
jgi:hypothetical protein